METEIDLEYLLNQLNNGSFNYLRDVINVTPEDDCRAILLEALKYMCLISGEKELVASYFKFLPLLTRTK